MSFLLLGILNSQAAAGGATAYDLLETVVTTSATNSVSFTGLDSYTDYKHLQVRSTMQATSAFNGNNASFNFKFYHTGNTTSFNTNHGLYGNGSSVSSTGAIGGTTFEPQDIFPGNQNTDIFGAFVLDVLDFSSSNKRKTIRLLGGAVNNNEKNISFYSGVEYDSAGLDPIITMTFDPPTDMSAGSRFSLYGVK